MRVLYKRKGLVVMKKGKNPFLEELEMGFSMYSVNFYETMEELVKGNCSIFPPVSSANRVTSIYLI